MYSGGHAIGLVDYRLKIVGQMAVHLIDVRECVLRADSVKMAILEATASDSAKWCFTVNAGLHRAGPGSDVS